MTNHRSSPQGPDAVDLRSLKPPFAPSDAAVAWLFRLQRLGIRPGLEAVGELLDRMGRPDRDYPCIVVAGTNGKGTAATALASFCQAAGLRTGLYTSPHLLDVRERILVDGQMIPQSDLFALVSEHRSRIETTRATFFESLTALACRYFAQREVDVAILETGLGGRLDATNAVRKGGVVLTSIGMDHEELLGNSLESIAREKLGLATAETPFYLCPLDEAQIEELAARILERVGAECVPVSELAPRLTSPDELAGVDAGGRLQREQVRAMLAVYRDLAARLGWPETDVCQSHARLRLPARFEAWGRSPRLILDTAHNASALQKTFQQWTCESDRDRRILVFGGSQGKSIGSAFEGAVKSARTILVSAAQWFRAWPAEELAQALHHTAVDRGLETDVVVVPSVREALESARARARAMSLAGPAPSVLVVGSHFLVAEALDRLGVDDLWQEDHGSLWDEGLPLRDRGLDSRQAAM